VLAAPCDPAGFMAEAESARLRAGSDHARTWALSAFSMPHPGTDAERCMLSACDVLAGHGPEKGSYWAGSSAAGYRPADGSASAARRLAYCAPSGGCGRRENAHIDNAAKLEHPEVTARYLARTSIMKKYMNWMAGGVERSRRRGHTGERLDGARRQHGAGERPV